MEENLKKINYVQDLEKKWKEIENELDNLVNKIITVTNAKQIKFKKTVSDSIDKIVENLNDTRENNVWMIIDRCCFLNEPPYLFSIPLKIARKIIGVDENGEFISHNNNNISFSNHRVFSLDGLHFKMDGMPSLTPGMEFAIYSFYSLLFGKGYITPSCFIGLKGKNILKNPVQQFSWYVFQVSKTIKGQKFDEWINKNSYEQLYEILDENNFSSLFIGNILTNPSDYKPDNFILKKKKIENKEKYFLVGIDNDMAFSYPILKISSINWQHELGVKTVLYCFTKLLEKPISSCIYENLCNIEPISFILLWLNILKQQNQRYLKMFNEQILKEYQLPLKFIPNVIQHIYNMLSQCINILKDNYLLKNITYGQLLQKIQPLVYYIYQQINQKYSTIQERLKAIYGMKETLESYLPLNKRLDKHINPKRPRFYRLLREYNYYHRDYEDHRTQSISSELLNLLETIDLTQYIDEKKEIVIFIFHIIGKYFLEEASQIKNKTWHNKEILKKLFEYPKNSEFVVELLFKLGLTLDILQLNIINYKGTILHNIIKNFERSEDYISLITKFVNSGININEMDSERKTILDIAMEKNLISIVIHLINLGAFIVQWRIALEFYEKNKENKNLLSQFQILFQKNRLIAWHITLHEIFPPFQNNYKNKEYNNNENNNNNIENNNIIKIPYMKIQERVIPKNIWNQIFDENGNIKKINKTGRANVSKIIWKNEYFEEYIYLKFFPELPGFESFISKLFQSITKGYGAPYVQLVNFSGFPCLFSQGVIGDTLQTVLQSNSSILNDLDLENFFRLIIATIIIAPEDGKPDNYILSPLYGKENKYQLFSIDNDHGLAEPIAKEYIYYRNQQKIKCVPQIKSILFCFDQMYIPLTKNIIQEYINTNFESIFQELLRKMNSEQQESTFLFTSEEAIKFLQENSCFIGVPLKTNMVSKAFDRAIRIQQFLQEHKQDKPPPTPFMLLNFVEPIVAKRYDWKPKGSQLRSILERFYLSDGKYFEKSSEGFITTTTLDAILFTLGIDIRDIPKKIKLIEEVKLQKGIGPAQTLDEFQKKSKKTFEDCSKIEEFEKLTSDEYRRKFLENLKPIVISFQKQWLKRLMKVDCRQLYLRPFSSVLKDNHLIKKIDINNLTWLDVEDCKQLSNGIISFLAYSCYALTFLNLSKTNITEIYKIEKNIPNPITFPNLRILYLNNCQNLNIVKLNAPELLEFHLFNTKNLQECSGEKNKLTYLDLRNASLFSDKALDECIKNSSQLKKLFLDGCENISYKFYREKFCNRFSTEFYENIKNIPINFEKLLQSDNYINQLDLSYNKIDSKGVELLSECLKFITTLTYLDLSFNNIESIGIKYLSETLKTNNNLSTLNISDNNIESLGIKYLSESLKTNNNLKILEIRNNNIGRSCIEYLSESLKINSSLITLDLSRNNIDSESLKYLSESLKFNYFLTTLHLSDNKFDSKGIDYLSKNLILNTTLKILDLSFNDMAESLSLEYLSEVLKFNSTLTTVDLRFNNIDSIGMKYLSDGLKINEKLQILDLSGNNFDFEGLKYLTESLKVNFSLTILNLSDNKINLNGIKNLSESLKVNTSLTTLYLSRNKFDIEGIKYLSEILKINHTLKMLDFKNNNIDSNGMDYLIESLKMNTTLTVLDLTWNNIEEEKLKIMDELIKKNQKNFKFNEKVLENINFKKIEQEIDVEKWKEWNIMNCEKLYYFENNQLKIENKNKKEYLYTALSIDGGGIRGYIASLILEKIQEIIGEKQDLFEYFDYIGGSSIGGILSLLITIPDENDDTKTKFKIQNLKEIFIKDSYSIFSKNSSMGIMKKFVKPKYNPIFFENILKKYFGEKTMLSSALTPVLITTLVEYPNEKKIGFSFLSNQSQKYEEDDYLMWEVARCTSIAPTYFPGYKIKNIYYQTHHPPINSNEIIPNRLYLNDNSYLLDGSLWFNNPSKLILESLKEHYQINNEDCLLISLGTGECPIIKIGKDQDSRTMIGTYISENMKNIDNHLKYQLNDRYIRIQPILSKYIEYDDIHPDNFLEMEYSIEKYYENIETITVKLIENYSNKSKYNLL